MVKLEARHEGSPYPRAAALFIHGLDGDPYETWNFNPQSRRTFWPLWLREAFPDLATYTIGYEASKSEWRGGHALAIEERATSLKNYLATELKPGKRLHGLPLVLITHSMGGLIAKAMLRSSSENPNRGPNDLLEQTCGVVFMATPHAGSNLAWWAKATAFFTRPTAAVRDMLPNDRDLRKLNKWYRDRAKEHGIRSYAFYETKDTKGLPVVDAASADPAIEGLDVTPIDANHIDIAKPLDETAPQYVETVDFLRETLKQLDEKGGCSAVNAPLRDAQVQDDADWQDRYGYRSRHENAFPACADLHVKTRQGTDRRRISATASLRCRRERLRGDDSRVFWLSARSVSLTLHVDGGEILSNRGPGDDEDDGEFRLARGLHNVIAISKPESPDLDGLPLDNWFLPEVRAFQDNHCSLEVQVGAFPEELNIDVVSADGDTRLQHTSELRRKLMKIVVGKSLDRVAIKHGQADHVDEQLILSRTYLWPEEPK